MASSGTRIGLPLTLAAATAVLGVFALSPSAGVQSQTTSAGAAAQPMPVSAPSVCTNPADMPAGYDYPQQPGVIPGWVRTRNEVRARVHGWWLWAALNSVSGGQPVWRSWCTSTQAFPNPADPQSVGGAAAMNTQRSLIALRRMSGLEATAKAGEDPINFTDAPVYPVPQSVQNQYPKCYNGKASQLYDGPTFQNNGDLMIAGVIYNPSAYNWITGSKPPLNLAATLQGQLPSPGGTASISEFPAGSIILKPMMWPIQASGYTTVPLWDPLPPSADGGHYAGFEIQKLWPRAVAVSPQAQPGKRVSVTYLYGVKDSKGQPLKPRTYASAAVVPLSDFYVFRPDLGNMADCDRAILDQSAWWAYNRAFQQGDYIALVAMHVMTKEQPDWTFQSVWWHDRPNQGPYALNRPIIPAAPGPWRHYLMTSTYGFRALTGARQADKWPIAFNPYIELAASHPIATNCINCHHRAAWPQSPTGYEAPGGPGALDVYNRSNPIFTNELTVDAVWSISDRAYGPLSIVPPGR
jgi:hypothetical protein